MYISSNVFYFNLQVINPKLSEMAMRCGGGGGGYGNKGGRWGYKGGFRGRENSKPSHSRFGGGGGGGARNNGYSNNGMYIH